MKPECFGHFQMFGEKCICCTAAFDCRDVAWEWDINED